MNLRALSLGSILLLAACGSETETVQTIDVADAENNAAAEAPSNDVASAPSPAASSGIQQSLLTIPNDIFSALPEKNATRTALLATCMFTPPIRSMLLPLALWRHLMMPIVML